MTETSVIGFFFSLAWVYEVIEIFWLYFSACVWIVVNQSESSI